jgi:hypothetical protein
MTSSLMLSGGSVSDTSCKTTSRPMFYTKCETMFYSVDLLSAVKLCSILVQCHLNVENLYEPVLFCMFWFNVFYIWKTCMDTYILYVLVHCLLYVENLLCMFYEFCYGVYNQCELFIYLDPMAKNREVPIERYFKWWSSTKLVWIRYQNY